jgi:hypothetical protein
VVGELPYKQLANHVYGLIVFPGPAVYSNPYSNPPIGCSRAITQRREIGAFSITCPNNFRVSKAVGFLSQSSGFFKLYYNLI